MRICIMHFTSSILRSLLVKKNCLEFLYEILLVLFRCCFHYLVENLILYKKDIQHFYIGPILFSEHKIIRSVVGGKVDGEILFGARSEKPKILFGARDEKRKMYLVPNDSYEKFYLAVKWLRLFKCKAFHRSLIISCCLTIIFLLNVQLGMYSIDKKILFSKRACLSSIKKNRQTFHMHQFDNFLLRGRTANFTNYNIIESTIIFSFSLVKITCEFTTSKKIHP